MLLKFNLDVPVEGRKEALAAATTAIEELRKESIIDIFSFSLACSTLAIQKKMIVCCGFFWGLLVINFDENIKKYR